MRLKRIVLLIKTIAPALLLSACEVGPDFQSPAVPSVERMVSGPLVTGDGKQQFVAGADIPGQWWQTFHSTALNNLIERALRQNADLQSAQAALRAARENSFASRGILFPQLSAEFLPTGGKVGNDVAPVLNTTSPTYSLTTAQLSVSYTPDVFGLNRRQIESADALAKSQRFQLEAAYLTLTSNIVLAAIQEASLRAQIAATKKIITIESDLAKTLKHQQELGQIALADVLVQEAALAQAQQTLPPLEKQLGINRDLLTALAGQFPDDESIEKFELGSLKLPRELPVSLPSSLIEHRPDIGAAEANLESASALIGVAVANRLPVINLTAQGGTQAANFANLFSPPTAFYQLAGSAAQTLFDGGTLLHKQKQAEAEFDQAYSQYRSTAITAFQNVSDALRALQSDTKAIKAAEAYQVAAERSLNVIRSQLQLGQVSTIVVLNAEQTYFQALLSNIQAKANRYADTAALFQALGGGWWNRTDVAEAAHDH